MTTSDSHEVWITGIGLVSCLGDGPEEHWRALNERDPVPDLANFAPYIVHPPPEIDFSKQIPKKSDQRQMELGQRLGVYAAGMALQKAGLAGNTTLLADTDLMVAAGGGERDLAVDVAILRELPAGEAYEAYLNKRLLTELRPTLFLGQLPNLFAGNISIVHGVTGASRTFLGEESAGVEAIRIAASRVASGQSKITLVGGSGHSARKDWLVYVSAAGQALTQRFAPVFERAAPSSGLALGSLGAFLVLEAADHARSRRAPALARLSLVLSDCTTSENGDRQAALEAMWQTIAPRLCQDELAVISGATGAEPATTEERGFLMAHPQIPVRATGTYLGHGVEATFPMNIALGVLSLARGDLHRATGGFELARPLKGPLTQVIVTSVGRAQGEGMALLEIAT